MYSLVEEGQLCLSLRREEWYTALACHQTVLRDCTRMSESEMVIVARHRNRLGFLYAGGLLYPSLLFYEAIVEWITQE